MAEVNTVRGLDSRDDVGNLAGRPVNRVGFGAMQLAGGSSAAGTLASPSREAALYVLRQAVELGVNHIDTAEFYGAGAVNALIRDALLPYPADLMLVSKVGAVHDDERGLVTAQRPEELRAGVEANLRSLGVEQLAVVNLRRTDGGLGIRADGDQRVDLDSQLAELLALRDEGKIGGIGLSNVTADQLRAALPAGPVCVQNYYNLLERSDEPMLEMCRENDIAWVPFCPLGSAFQNLAKVTDQPEVIAVAKALGVTPAQAGLAWLLGHAPNVLLIAGTSSTVHLTENVAAADIRLDPETTAALDRLAESTD